ncbi:MAG TPA: signal recognition particle receptor subunit alpha, partial [Pseudonocardiaceae bacterium]|nr:signal recognition particle receptor subunit alpha [Pseudonocardiaceae bacterium]
MSTTTVIIIVVAVVVVLLAVLGTGLALRRSRRISLSEKGDDATGRPGYQAGGGISLAPGGARPEHPVADRPEVDGQPAVGDDASVPRDAPKRGIVDVGLPGPDAVKADAVTEPVPVQTEPATDPIAVADVAAEEIAPVSGRLERLRGRLSRSQNTLGHGLLGLLGAGNLDEDSWTEIEDTLLMADLGAATTTEIVDRLRTELSSRGVRTEEQARTLLRDVLV